MKHIFILSISLVISGCTGIFVGSNCIDAKKARESIPVSDPVVIDFQYKESAKQQIKIQCEKYYDSQCSARGNYWDYREVGKSSSYDLHELVIQDENIGEISFSLPKCKDLMNLKSLSGKEIQVEINGHRYSIIYQTGDSYRYKADYSVFNPDLETQYELRYSFKIWAAANKQL